MGKLKTVYQNLPLKKALTITIVGSLFIAFLGAMTILLWRLKIDNACGFSDEYLVSYSYGDN